MGRLLYSGRWRAKENGEGGIEIRNHMDHNTKFDQYCVQMGHFLNNIIFGKWASQVISGQVISVDFE